MYSHKKRKSDLSLDGNHEVKPKKDRPWFDEESSHDHERSEGKDRRKSFLGFGTLMRKIKSTTSSSSLKVSKWAASSDAAAAPPLSAAARFAELSSASEADSSSCRSESSFASSADGNVADTLRRNVDLQRFVETGAAGGSTTDLADQSTSAISEPQFAVPLASFDTDDMTSYTSDSGSISSSRLTESSSFCTPQRNPSRFSRASQLRSSSRSMPGSGTEESDLVRSLCNSAVRRAHSTTSEDSNGGGGGMSLKSLMTSPFRRKSMRIRNRVAAGGGSMADLPEELEDGAFPAPLGISVTSLDEEMDISENAQHNRLSLCSSVDGIFPGTISTNPHGGSTNSLTPMRTLDSFDSTTPVAVDDGVSRSGKLKKSANSASSIHKKMSSLIRRGFGGGRSVKDVENTPPTAPPTAGTSTVKIRRAATGKFQRSFMVQPSPMRRVSDAGEAMKQLNYTPTMLPHAPAAKATVKRVDTRKDAQSRAFRRIVSVADVDALEAIVDSKCDAVAVDVLANGQPVSDVSSRILSTPQLRDAVKKVCYQWDLKGVLEREDEPDLLIITTESADAEDKRVRLVVAKGLEKALALPSVQRLLLYPAIGTCSADGAEVAVPDLEVREVLYNQMFDTIYRTFSWNQNTEKLSAIVVAAERMEDVDLLKKAFNAFVEKQVVPHIIQERKEDEAEPSSSTPSVSEEPAEVSATSEAPPTPTMLPSASASTNCSTVI